MSENSGISLEYFVLNSTNWTNGSPWRRGRPGKVSVKMCAETVQNLIGIAVKTGIFHDIIPRYFQTAKLCDVHTKMQVSVPPIVVIRNYDKGTYLDTAVLVTNAERWKPMLRIQISMGSASASILPLDPDPTSEC
jgi:hypothetical protein